MVICIWPSYSGMITLPFNGPALILSHLFNTHPSWISAVIWNNQRNCLPNPSFSLAASLRCSRVVWVGLGHLLGQYLILQESMCPYSQERWSASASSLSHPFQFLSSESVFPALTIPLLEYSMSCQSWLLPRYNRGVYVCHFHCPALRNLPLRSWADLECWGFGFERADPSQTDVFLWLTDSYDH